MTPLQKPNKPTEFKAFEPIEHASLLINFLTKMTDANLDYLPYGVIVPYQNPAFAEHSRIDDAEFVAAWYEGLSCVREMLGTNRGADVEESLYKHLVNEGWDSATGLRFPPRRPWSGELDYCMVSEMSVVLSALNRAIKVSKDDKVAEKRAAALVKGLKKLAENMTRRISGTGVVEVTEQPCYSFPSDVYMKGEGFSTETSSGFSDALLRNASLIYPLVERYTLTGDENALDLATGLANRITYVSHYFTYRNEFSGHVHSALWTAIGLAKLGKLRTQDKYVAKAKGIYDYVRRNSSAFGWVPEYLQWQLMADERSSTCGIADMMTCAVALVECGFPEYWDDVHRFWRNHLTQNQITDTSFIAEAGEGVADTEQRTYTDMKDRLLGWFSCGSMPNAIQFRRYGSLSGCCVSAAARAMLLAWQHTMDFSRNILTVNFPVNCETSCAKITVGYPNAGFIRIKLKKNCRVMLRVFPWMPSPHEGTIDGRPAGLERRDDLVSFPACEKGALLELKHELKTRRIMENVMGLDFFGLWRGPEMVDILPHGLGMRLYQRAIGVPPDRPSRPSENNNSGRVDIPIEPPTFKETRLNRRKPPRS